MSTTVFSQEILLALVVGFCVQYQVPRFAVADPFVSAGVENDRTARASKTLLRTYHACMFVADVFGVLAVAFTWMALVEFSQGRRDELAAADGDSDEKKALARALAKNAMLVQSTVFVAYAITLLAHTLVRLMYAKGIWYHLGDADAAAAQRTRQERWLARSAAALFFTSSGLLAAALSIVQTALADNFPDHCGPGTHCNSEARALSAASAPFWIIYSLVGTVATTALAFALPRHEHQRIH